MAVPSNNYMDNIDISGIHVAETIVKAIDINPPLHLTDVYIGKRTVGWWQF